MIDFEQMKTLVEFMKENKVWSFKCGDVAIQLELDAPQPVVFHDQPVAQSTQEVKEAPVRGADGLTKEEQEELYGRPMDV